MDFLSQIIGFLIVIFIFLFPILLRMIEKKVKQTEKTPQPAKKQGASQSKKSASFPKPPQLPKKKFDFHSQLEAFQQKNRIEQYQLETHVNPHFKKEVASRDFWEETSPSSKPKTFSTHLFETSSLKKLVIYHTIFDKPRSLKPYDEH